MLDAQKVLSNMVLFHCKTCNERFPTWHPQHRPEFELECLKNCDVEAHEWYDMPGEERTRHATLHRGMCRRCHKSLEKVANKPLLQGVATFSARNNFDPLFGIDIGAAYKEWMYLSLNATVVESMLVALDHMQVSVCYLRNARRFGRGIPAFHKNIISFPQDINDMKNLAHFFSTLATNDIINVRVPALGGSEGAVSYTHLTLPTKA